MSDPVDDATKRILDGWDDPPGKAEAGGAYIAGLNKLVANQEAARAAEIEAAEAVAINAARRRLAPLVDRVAALLGTIPPSVQREGIGIPQLQPSLRGRRGSKAHQGEIAAALRAVGWTSRRSWKVGSSHAKRWFPPGA